MHKTRPPGDTLLLGIECGGTHTLALLANANGAIIRQATAGPANLRLLTDPELVKLLRAISRTLGLTPSAMAIGMAGARTPSDRARICSAAAQVWPGVPCHATNDLETGLMAAEDPTNQPDPAGTRILVLSGTGSCCFGRAPNGRTVKVGGWGHILGDKASGYDIALRALKAIVHSFDCHTEWPKLGRRFLRALQLNEPDDLIAWVQAAGKTEIAALAPEVFTAWSQRDPIADDILASAAETLAKDAVACARRLARPGTPVQFVLAGSILLKQPRFAGQVSRRIHRLWPRAAVLPLARNSAWGAVALARRLLGAQHPAAHPTGRSRRIKPPTDSAPPADLRALLASPTEQRNPRSMNLDKLPLPQAIDLMLREDARIPAAIRAERNQIERAIRLIIRAFRRGGRLLYVGAGTSGRLGVLDASECPPTFQAPPEMVQGIIAGGQQALWTSIEGAEDDPEAGARAIQARGVNAKDVVVGIAASGRTPFVWGALEAAKRHRAATVLLAFNPSLVIPRHLRPRVIITPNLGPEVLTGSTRLKAGTATKLILNMFTTLAMVRLGKVISNLMVDVKASNAKLRDRAVRIVQALTGLDYASAHAALLKHHWHIKTVFRQLGNKSPLTSNRPLSRAASRVP